ncbi:MAG TPA: apolipoprotein N-acyltransferase, partial [Cellvibrionales bacterium]|nr:apolipoprotein N-acyltransferase [Cellvibrionales bacterium]
MANSQIFRSFCALISGALITLSLAPFAFWPLAIIATAILFVVLQQQSIKRSFWLGWFFGLGLFGTGASWVYVSIHEFGYTSIYLA